MPASRVGLPHGRRAALGIVADEDVDPVRREIHFAALVAGGGNEQRVIGDDLALQRIDPLGELLRLSVFFPDLVQVRADRRAADLGFHIRKLGLERALLLPDLPQHFQSFRGQGVGHALEALLLFPRQRFEFVGLKFLELFFAFAVLDDFERNVHKPLRRALDEETVLFGLFANVIHHLRDLVLKRADFLRFGVFVAAFLEGAADHGLQFFDQLVEVFLGFFRLPGRQVDGQRRRRLVEIVDVDPVVGRRQAGRFFAHAFQRVTRASAALRPDDKDVVAGALDGKAEIDRFDSPLLSDKMSQAFQLRRRRTAQHLGIRLSSHLRRRQFPGPYFHGLSPSHSMYFINPPPRRTRSATS